MRKRNCRHSFATLKKKQRLTRRTRMLSDNDLLDIMRMRAAHSSKDNKVAEHKTDKPCEPESPGAAATLGTHLAAGEEPAASASEGNAEQLPDSPA